MVTVETIHRSKGLEYDVVIFINNDKKSFTEKNIKAYRNESQGIDWVLEPFKKDVMQALDKTSELIVQTRQENHFSSLCKLYVAMTRPKKALYMMSDLNSPQNHTTVDFLKTYLSDSSEEKELFEDQAFSVLWESGNPNWHQSLNSNRATDINTSEKRIKGAVPLFQPTHQRLSDFIPSRETKNDFHSFSNISSKSRKHGQLVHYTFEQMDWYDDTITLESQLDKEIDSSTLESLKACFNTKSIQEIFQKPNNPCILWKEKAFTLSEKQVLINGVFDRVHIFLDKNNRYQKAQIIDFKTDLISEESSLAQAIEKHQIQLKSYQNALSKLLNLDKDKIETYLLFTSVAAIHQVY